MRSHFPLIGFTFLAVCASSTAHAAPSRTVTLLHIADTHAQLETHPEYMPGEVGLPQMGGYARLKTAIDRARASAGAATFVADGGDTFQGSAAAAWSNGEVVVAPLNALGLDVCVPGNWEVVYGPERFKKLMGELSCKVLAYNFHDTRTGARLFAPSVVIERGGVRVAFVGITDPTTTQRQPPEEVRGLDSTRMEGLREHVRELRGKADLVVAVTHTGLTVSRQLAREIPELDVVLSGHTHERTTRAILEGKVIIVEPGSMGSFLGRLDVTLAPSGGVTGHDFQLIEVRAGTVAEDPAVKSIVDAALKPYRARVAEVVGRSETALERYDVLETSADDFITDAVHAETHADIATSNGFRFAPPIAAGPLTEGDLWQLLPLDSRVKVGWVTGAELRSYLERELELVFSRDTWKLSGGWGPRLSGVRITFQAGAPAGHRVRSITVAGKPLEDARHYSFAGCERAGEPLDVVCRLPGVHDVKIFSPSIHATLRSYLHGQPVIAPHRDGREVAIDLPPTVFSQDAVLAGFRALDAVASVNRPAAKVLLIALTGPEDGPRLVAPFRHALIMKSSGKASDVAIVVYGRAVLGLVRSHKGLPDALGPAIDEALKAGVPIYVCEHSLAQNGIDTSAIRPEVHPVPTGAAKVAELVAEGYAPIQY